MARAFFVWEGVGAVSGLWSDARILRANGKASYGFLGVSFKKFVYYWAGVPKLSNFPPPEVKNALFLASSILCFWGLLRALRKRKPGAWLFFWLLLCYPLVYYVVFPHARYRHPIDPEIGILAVFLINEAEKKPRRV